ncbi:uncharacterized protein LOC127705183 isoform X3 [Mytilus californianus]|uniref:uncharacterized protein LOC127705183 isoform X3 n=1 Tax=Mytilus californianus TaxID=6549 RepID=UPI0022481C2C|nr:uncharacterized protein LOC127705183 isoform X3 [Mytilus californianus]
MNQYQKVYMNQIHSSSLLGQLAQMWKSQMLCDALIRTGNVTTKAHRVVLVAACPMLQSMDNASVGSHLEVRLAADIKQEAVNSFLQYLYEGFMMLSEENCKDVEKVARLLQVDSVTKCCIDFYNCLQKKTGVPVYSNTQYKYSSADLLEFRHVRTTDLQKTLHERMMKRAAADSVRPTSPSGKRQRMQQQRPPSPNIDLAMFGQKADDTLSMAHSYMGNIGNQAAAEPWERVPRIGAIHSQRQSHPKPGVIEIVEDSLEILQTQPPDKDGNKSAPPIIQKSLAISVSSQVNSSTDVHVVNVNDSSSHPTAAGDGPIMSTGRDSITVSPLTVMPGTSSLSSSSTSSPLTKDPHKSAMDKDMSDKQPYAKKLQSSLDHQSSTPQRGLFPVSISPANMSPINQVKKSFAAGSASQAASMSQSHDSPAKRTPTSAVNEMERPPSSDSGKDLGTKSKVDDRSALNSTDMAPDLSIVKVEPTGEAGLDMYVDVPEESMIQAQQREQREHDDESDLELEEASGDWSRDEMSNEAAGGDQNNSWYIGQFKGLKPLEQNGEEDSTQGIQIQCSTGLAYDTFYGTEQGPVLSNTAVPVWPNIKNEIYSCPSNIVIKPAKSSGKGKQREVKNLPAIPGITVPFQTKATKRANKTVQQSKPKESNRTANRSRNNVDIKTTTKDKRGRHKSPTKTARKSPDTGNRKIMPKPEVIKSFINEKKGRIASKVIQPGNQNPKLLDTASPKKMKSEKGTPRGKVKYKFTIRKSLKKISGKKYVVKDSNFWNMPLLAITSIESPNKLTTGDLSGLFGCVPTGDSIDGDITSLALEDCMSNRGRFALALFHYIISIGELYNRNISGTKNKMKINPFKIKMIRDLTFKHFPAANGEEEVEWKYIVNRMHVVIWHAEKFIQKWLIVKPLNHYSLE